MPDCDEYDCYQYAGMETTYPINVTDRINLQLHYSIHYDLEPDYDYLYVCYSWDKSHWYLVRDFTDYSNDWVNYTDYIEGVGSTLYIAFDFSSDFTNEGYWYGGAFLDDIEVTGDPVTRPNLTWAWPGYFTWPIVASPVTGTYTVGQLWGYDPAYIDWACQNMASVASGGFRNKLYIDGSLAYTQTVSGLSPQQVATYTDYPVTLPPGSHSLELYVDADDQVQETNEADNYYAFLYDWDPPTLTVNGTATYWDMNPPPTQRPIRCAPIELRDADGTSSEKLAEATTDDQGRFSFPTVSNHETNGDGGRQDILLRIYASNDAAYCTAPGYVVPSSYSSVPVQSNLANGNRVFDYPLPQDAGGHFFPLDAIKSARDKWFTQVLTRPSGQARVVVSASTGTYTDPNDMTIYLNSSTAGSSPDNFDRNVICHEYGHWIADSLLFFDIVAPGGHSWNSAYPPITSGSEGFAHFFAAWESGASLMHNRYSNFTQDFQRNVETGEWAFNGIVDSSANNRGDSCEASVAGMLWDIYDTPNDDYSTYGQRYALYNPDGVGDTLDNGINNIITALTSQNRMVSGHHPRTIEEFYSAWFMSPPLGHKMAMGDIWYEHGNDTHLGCCTGTTGNVNMSGIVDLSDLSLLLAYLTNPPASRPVLPCPDEANVNGTGIIDMADLSLLIAYLGPPPRPTLPDCP